MNKNIGNFKIDDIMVFEDFNKSLIVFEKIKENFPMLKIKFYKPKRNIESLKNNLKIQGYFLDQQLVLTFYKYLYNQALLHRSLRMYHLLADDKKMAIKYFIHFMKVNVKQKLTNLFNRRKKLWQTN